MIINQKLEINRILNMHKKCYKNPVFMFAFWEFYRVTELVKRNKIQVSW